MPIVSEFSIKHPLPKEDKMTDSQRPYTQGLPSHRVNTTQCSGLCLFRKLK